MDVHEIKVKGSRYFVFNEDDYEGESGMYDCVLITDDIDEAESLAIEISHKLYFPSSAAIFDAEDKKYYSYVNGELDEEQSKSIKFI